MPTVTTTVEDTSPVLQWSSAGDWVRGTSESDNFTSRYSQGSFMATNVSGASMSFTFVGTSVTIYGSKRANHGLFQVQVDDTTYDPVNGTAEDPGVFQQQLFSADELKNEKHVVTVTNQGSTYFDVDFVTWTADFGQSDEPLTVVTVQDSNRAVRYDPPNEWATDVANVGMYFGGTGHASSAPGSLMKYKFSGNAISVFGPVSPDGASYSVELDGQPAQNYSSNSARFVPQTLLYYAGGLKIGKHTIKITHLAQEVDGSQVSSGQVLGIDFINLYTAPSFDAQSNDRLPPTTIAGIAVGTIAGLIVFLILITYHIRRKNTKRDRDRDRDRTHTHRKSSSGLLKLFSGGESGPSQTAKIKKKKAKGPNAQPFEIDGGGEYAPVGMTDRDSTAYLIPDYGPPGVVRGGDGSGGGGDSERGTVGTGGLRVHNSAFSSLAGSSRTQSHSTGGSRLGQTSLSAVSVLNQPVVVPLAELEMGVVGNGNHGIGPSHHRMSTSGSLSSLSGAQRFSVPLINTAVNSSPGSQPEPRRNRYSRTGSNGSQMSSPLGARPMSAYSQIQSPSPHLQQSSSSSQSQVQSQTQRQSQIERKPTILPPLPPGAARPLPQTELASPVREELGNPGL